MRGGHNKKIALKVVNGNKMPDPVTIEQKKARCPGWRRCPGWLSDHSKRFWRHWAPKLERLDLLTETDIPAFTSLAMLYGQIREAEAQLADQLVVRGARGGTVKNPLISILGQARKDFRLLAQDFGLTPLSRGRMNIDTKSTKEDQNKDLFD